MEKRTIKIDPRIFINEPYIACPKCKKVTFGVLTMTSSKNGYTRRCKNCWHTERFPLPVLEKKVLYLDQFAISHLMLALNSKLGKKDRVDKFWLAFFEKLERVHRLQLIECPDSTFHQTESQLGAYKPLKKMYEHFSGGTTFYDPMTIRRFQVSEYFQKWLGVKVYRVTRDDVIQGNFNEWSGRIYVTIDSKINAEFIEEERKSKERTVDSLKPIFDRWKGEKHKKFNDWFREEGLAWGKAMSERYAYMLAKMFQSQLEQKALDPANLFEYWEEQVLIHSLSTYVPEKDQLEKTKKVTKFLLSEEMLHVPFNEISAALWAALAHQAAHGGRTNPPGRGMKYDMDMISTLLPYCDAMFVDREMKGLLELGEVKKRIKKYGTKILSLADKDEIMDYLDDLEKSTKPEHIKLVEQIYGEDWVKPYWTIYDDSQA